MTLDPAAQVPVKQIEYQMYQKAFHRIHVEFSRDQLTCHAHAVWETEVSEQAASFVPKGCKTSTSMFNNDFPQLSRCQTRCTPIPLGFGLKRIASSIIIIHYQYLPDISISPI